jgi:hypothetical protein
VIPASINERLGKKWHQQKELPQAKPQTKKSKFILSTW